MCDNVIIICVDIHIHLKSQEVESICGQTSLVSVLSSTGTVFLSMLSLLVLWTASRTAWIHVQSGAFISDSLLSPSTSSIKYQVFNCCAVYFKFLFSSTKTTLQRHRHRLSQHSVVRSHSFTVSMDVCLGNFCKCKQMHVVNPGKSILWIISVYRKSWVLLSRHKGNVCSWLLSVYLANFISLSVLVNAREERDMWFCVFRPSSAVFGHHASYISNLSACSHSCTLEI